MRLLAVTNMYPSPARPWFGTFVEQQVKGLLSAGVEVKLLYFDRKTEGPLIYHRMKPRIARAIEEFRPHLLHLMYGGVMAGKAAAGSWPVPVIVTFHGSDLLGENLNGFMRRLVSHHGVRCSWRAARRASGVVVVSKGLEAALPKDVNRRKVRVIPCGIDLDRFKPIEQESCRRELGWAPGVCHVLFPSNTGDPVKRPWLAASAVRALQANGVKAELHMLTGVAYAEVPRWINASDVLLLTSLHEGSPMVVKEALACGVPVVSVDVGDVAERISGVEGCHLALSEEGDLARKLSEVWSRRSRVDAAKAAQDFSLGRITERLMLFYGEVLQTAGSDRDANPRRSEAV